jgi:hypothetical protein
VYGKLLADLRHQGRFRLVTAILLERSKFCKELGDAMVICH